MLDEDRIPLVLYDRYEHTDHEWGVCIEPGNVSVTSFTICLIKKFKYFCSIDKPLEMITFIFLDNVPEDPYPFALVDDKVSF